jgi:hypothetical protein
MESLMLRTTVRPKQMKISKIPTITILETRVMNSNRKYHLFYLKNRAKKRHSLQISKRMEMEMVKIRQVQNQINKNQNNKTNKKK